MSGQLKKWALAGWLMASSLGAWGLPEGANPVHGTLQIESAGQLMQILQSSPQAIINWNSFNIGPGQQVRILQPSQMATLLNRVVGQDPSLLEGRLSANGQVFLLNPNGILFGSGARVDVGSFMASTLQMTDSDFLAGNYRLTQSPDHAMTALVNRGELRVADGGFVVLVSPLVHQDGLILAQAGQVRLGAAQEATFSVDGQGLLQFIVPQGFRPDFSNPMPGGTVAMAPAQMTELLSSVVRHPNVREATGLPPEGLLVHSGTSQVGSGSLRLDSSRACVRSFWLGP